LTRNLQSFLTITTFLAVCGCSDVRHVVSVHRCGKIELLCVRYDSTLGDSLCRVILEGRSPDTTGAMQPVEYWFRPSFDYSSHLLDIRTAQVRPGETDTVVILSNLYHITFRATYNRDRTVHSMELPLYHSHEYRLRAYIDPVCEVQWTLP